jgi:hypothetical protein
MPASQIKSKNPNQQQVTNEGRSNHDDTKGVGNSTTMEMSADVSTTSGTTVETTTEEIISDTTTTAMMTDSSTTSTVQLPTMPLQTTLETSGDNDTQERFVMTQTEDSQVTTVTTILSDEEENLVAMQTETTFMTLFPTTMIIPKDIYVANITVHSNVTIIEKDDNVTALNGSLLPVRAIPPEIEAILNITHKRDDDYVYDYNEPSLPPSLPNLR